LVGQNVELTFDIEISDKSERKVDLLKKIPGVESVSLISYQNDIGV
jgi:cell division protein FtsX